MVTAGNHDSPSLLNAPREVLRHLNVHVVGCMAEAAEDELVVLHDSNGKPELIISHVSTLKERIGTQIQVEAGSAGRSSLSGPGCQRVA